MRGTICEFRANASLRPPVKASQALRVRPAAAPSSCKCRQKDARSQREFDAEYPTSPPARMSHPRHSCRSRVFANTHETVCFLPLVCGLFLAAIRANMQSHPLYLTPAPFPAALLIALFRASTSTYALLRQKLVQFRGHGRGHECPPTEAVVSLYIHSLRAPVFPLTDRRRGSIDPAHRYEQGMPGQEERTSRGSHYRPS